MHRARLLLLATLFLLPACVIRIGSDAWRADDWRGRGLRGSGVAGARLVEVGAFTRLRVECGADVRVVAGREQRLSISADDNLLDRVHVRVEDGCLRIATGEEPLDFRCPLRVEIECHALQAAELASGGLLVLEGLSGAEFTGSIAGSGTFVAKGRVERALLSITGSGALRCGELEARHVQVSISGSGQARVQASESLTASIAGSGEVRVRGNPPVLHQTIAGSGAVLRE